MIYEEVAARLEGENVAGLCWKNSKKVGANATIEAWDESTMSEMSGYVSDVE